MGGGQTYPQNLDKQIKQQKYADRKIFQWGGGRDERWVGLLLLLLFHELCILIL